MPWSESPSKSITPRATANAKLLRRTQTEPEKRLWWHLRHRLPIAGSHFRRQLPIGAYIADFCCLSARLIGEVDGDQHGFDAQAAYDAKRTKVLERDGYRILRFTDAEVMREIDVVLDTIAAARAGAGPAVDGINGTTPTPDPSPQGGGE